MPSWQDAPLVSPGASAVPSAQRGGPAKPTEQQAKYSLYSMARYDLDELEDIVAKGGTPQWRDAALEGFAQPTGIVGPLAGSMQSGTAKRYYAAAGRLADSIEKAFTGAQSSEIEHLRYISSNIPAFYDDPATVKSKFTGIRRRLNALDMLAHGVVPTLEDVEGAPPQSPAPAGQMGPPPAAKPAPKRLRYNAATGELE